MHNVLDKGLALSYSLSDTAGPWLEYRGGVERPPRAPAAGAGPFMHPEPI